MWSSDGGQKWGGTQWISTGRGTESHTHQLIRISWLGLYNVTGPASSLPSDRSRCWWLCWFISLALQRHPAMISHQTEFVIMSPAACFSDALRVNGALCSPEGFIEASVEYIAAKLDSSSRAKPFLNEYKYKSVMLNIVWLSTAPDN